ncbi:MAG: hypothetical protein AAF415_04535 [Pseudomonadota bacterium]
MVKETSHEMDPSGLIGDSYSIEGIGAEDCRSIFFDWALGLPSGQDAAEAARLLLDHHQPPEEHPMTDLLRDAMTSTSRPRRRGGRRR